MEEAERRASTSAEDGRPYIDTGNRELPEITADALAALKKANEPPIIFLRGDAPVGLEAAVGPGTPSIRQLDSTRMNYHVARAAHWGLEGPDGWVPDWPPVRMVADVLATPVEHLPFPWLDRIVDVPVFGPTGNLRTAAGYDPGTRTYFKPGAYVLPPVPCTPTATDVAAAKDLLLTQLLGDFRFEAPDGSDEEAGNPERAHAAALALQPFVRGMIDGPTPLYSVESPVPRTGKGLLVKALLAPACGPGVSMLAWTANEEELRKRLTSILMGGAEYVVFDNIPPSELNSAVLSAATTTSVWLDRRLGGNHMERLAVKCSWVMTANNPAVSTEIAGRLVRVRLNAHTERPGERTGFRHPDLGGWAVEHRGELVWACLTLVSHWVAEGMPLGTETLGGFERWAGVMGGILEAAKIVGFLGNRKAAYDADAASWGLGLLVREWWDTHHDQSLSASELFYLARGAGLVFGDDHGARVQWGMQLARLRGVSIGGFEIQQVGTHGRAKQYRLVPETVDLRDAPSSRNGSGRVGRIIRPKSRG